MKQIDDRKLSLRLSLFLLLSAALSAAMNAMGGPSPNGMADNPTFIILVAAASLSLLYWLLRSCGATTSRSLAAVVALAALLLAFGMSGTTAYVVVSNSMRHNSDTFSLYYFWGQLGYSREEFDSFPFSGGFQAGDMIIAARTDDLKVGDVAVDTRNDVPIIHRIFFVNGTTVMTVSDSSLPWNASRPSVRGIVPRKDVYGKVVLVIPKAGIARVLYGCQLSEGCDFTACLTSGDCGERTFA